MRIIILLIIFSLCNFVCQSQVYFSQILENYVLLGPENVSDVNVDVANFYKSDLQGASNQLQKFISDNQNTIAKLKEGKVRKKVKREIEAIEFDTEKVQDELEIYLEYILLWEQCISQKTNEAALVIFIKDNPRKCIKIQTKIGDIDPKGLKIETKEIAEDPIEFIRMQTAAPRTMWVKKKVDNNCVSADPDDCLVWCLVEVTGGYSMSEGNIQYKSFEGCPKGFEINAEAMVCQRANAEVSGKDSKMFFLSTPDHTDLKVISWQKVDCSN